MAWSGAPESRSRATSTDRGASEGGARPAPPLDRLFETGIEERAPVFAAIRRGAPFASVVREEWRAGIDDARLCGLEALFAARSSASASKGWPRAGQAPATTPPSSHTVSDAAISCHHLARPLIASATARAPSAPEGPPADRAVHHDVAEGGRGAWPCRRVSGDVIGPACSLRMVARRAFTRGVRALRAVWRLAAGVGERRRKVEEREARDAPHSRPSRRRRRSDASNRAETQRIARVLSKRVHELILRGSGIWRIHVSMPPRVSCGTRLSAPFIVPPRVAPVCRGRGTSRSGAASARIPAFFDGLIAPDKERSVFACPVPWKRRATVLYRPAPAAKATLGCAGPLLRVFSRSARMAQ